MKYEGFPSPLPLCFFFSLFFFILVLVLSLAAPIRRRFFDACLPGRIGCTGRLRGK